MAVRAGQHVSGEGRIYHPYLANWRIQSQLLELLRVLQDIFSREPPVVAKQAPSRPAQSRASGAPPRPPLPGELRGPSSTSSNNGPPVPPPRPYDDRLSSSQQPAVPPRPDISHPVPRPPSHSYRHPPPIPYNHGPPQVSYSPVPHDNVTSPIGYQQSYQGSMTTSSQQTSHSRQPLAQSQVPPVPYGQHPSNHYQSQPNVHYQPRSSHAPQQQPKPKAAVQDLLTSPFDPPLPTSAADIPVPPIPPNPEKDALLSAISHQLTTQLQAVVASNHAAIQPLSAQHAAMTHAMHNLQQERGALLQLQSLLDSSEQILHQAIRDADNCIANAKHKAIANVDEVLVAPTVVGQQLYDLIAEEKACEDAREVLARALDRGRISSEVWVKTTRSLAREEFMKKVLIRKCAEGMGLQQDTTI